jgi:hypothetical protein
VSDIVRIIGQFTETVTVDPQAPDQIRVTPPAAASIQVQSPAEQGPPGVQGPQGPPGINQVTTSTVTDINGLLKGNGATVEAATPDVDYASAGAPAAAVAAHVAATDPHGDRAYADSLVVGLLDDRGSHDASAGLFPSTGGSGEAGTILKGDLWFISVAGTLGDQYCQIGTSIRALTDNPGQTASNWSIISTTLGFVPENAANKSTAVPEDSGSDIKYPSVRAVYDWVAPARAYDLNTCFVGKPGNSQILSLVLFPRAVTIPADFDGSYGLVMTNPASAYTITATFVRGGVTQATGTISIATGGAFTFSLASPYSAAAGDLLKLAGQATADSTLSDLAITIAGALAL